MKNVLLWTGLLFFGGVGCFSSAWAQASAGSTALKNGFKAYNTGDYSDAMKWYIAANAIAEYNIGVLYAYGQGVTQNYKEAMKWYRKAADGGNAPAENNIGVLYEKGFGVDLNLHKALDWYWKAAVQKNEFGIKNYERLKGELALMADRKKALKSHEKDQTLREESSQKTVVPTVGVGKEADEAPSQSGILDLNLPGPPGSGTGAGGGPNVHPGLSAGTSEQGNQDYAKAMQQYQKAAAQGNVQAEKNIAALYMNGQGVPKDYSEALKWDLKAAAQGDAAAQCSVGLFYDMGLGLPQDYQEAMNWYLKAAKQGNALADNCIGYCYENGHGVARDNDKALKWYEKAAVRGDATAVQNMENLKESMSNESTQSGETSIPDENGLK